MEDYRARLEDELIERMIDPETGQIRPEYANDPELSQYAEWAQARYDARVVDNAIDVLNDPNSTPEEKRTATDTIDSFDEIRAMRREADRLSPDVEPAIDQELEERTDGIRDAMVSTTSEASFGSPS
ncbi:hypothetical protein [Maricaulis sp. W15]|uniref:hypothetical protein n=1 Tax=Maricaulis sp. W15 TaxID=1772333 RepID=UPI000A5AC635|nr:hypothetical protein [Maricaulis sp. W15]